MEKFLVGLMVIGVFTFGICVGFLITSGLYWCVAWAFDLVFSWKYAVGIYIILFVLSRIFKK